MPKLNRGRVTGLEEMHGLTAAELEERAARMEAEAENPGSTNDPTWLRRWAQRLRSLAAQKTKALARRSRTRDSRAGLPAEEPPAELLRESPPELRAE